MIIGIMGTPLESSNLGCMALTYSMLIELEQIAKEKKMDFKYLVFDGTSNDNARQEICKALNINSSRIISGNMVMLHNPLRIIKNWNKYRKMKREIKSCDCIIDITGGDSFSDIYGDVTFYGRTNAKIMVARIGKPLLLAPQTYGPFQTEKSRKKASDAIEKADCVMTRDKLSQDVIRNLTGREALCCADMAFLLPFNRKENKDFSKVKIGLNISKLLYTESNEVTEKNFKLKTDYKVYTNKLLEKLNQMENVEISLIPHVGLDNDIHLELKKKFPNVIIVIPQTNPIEIKSIISTMDIFIGARMHGTIAAFTTGVACVPVAYSRKFSGLFKGINYEPLIDLQNMITEDAIQQTLNYVKNYEQLKKEVDLCQGNIDKQINELKCGFSNWITSIIQAN